MMLKSLTLIFVFLFGICSALLGLSELGEAICRIREGVNWFMDVPENQRQAIGDVFNGQFGWKSMYRMVFGDQEKTVLIQDGAHKIFSTTVDFNFNYKAAEFEIKPKGTKWRKRSKRASMRRRECTRSGT